MTPEEYERLKAAEKEHLRQLKTLKQMARTAGHKVAVNRALNDMQTGARDALEAGQEWIDRLQSDSALAEAQLEVAMEGRVPREDSTATSMPSQEDLAEMEKARARKLVEEMRAQLSTDSPRTEPTKEAGVQPREPGPGASDLPEKTIGRMRK